MQDAQSAGFSSGGKLPCSAFAEVVWTVLLRIIPIIQREAASPSQSLRDSSLYKGASDVETDLPPLKREVAMP